MNQIPHDREPETQTGMSALFSCVCLPKSVEHERQEFGTDTLAIVDDLNFVSRTGMGKLNLHPSTRRSKFQGIR
jgi:hypothetical protein